MQGMDLQPGIATRYISTIKDQQTVRSTQAGDGPFADLFVCVYVCVCICVNMREGELCV
jgi:hypothetical protein